MRRSREDKEESRQTILTEAARLFREKGIEGTSVADVMQAAGMTHGGFYKHFASKEDLLSAAVDRAFAAFAEGLEENTPRSKSAVEAFVSLYTSNGHVKNPGFGCPIAALGIEAGRAGGAVTSAFANGIARMIAALEAQMGAGTAATRKRAEVLLATLVGAVVLARASGKSSVSKDIAAAAHDQAKASR